MTLDPLTLWIVAGGIAAVALAVVLRQEIRALFDQPRNLTDDQIANAGDAFLATFDPLHSASLSEGAQRDHV
jgi:hypothetical protein